jgi:hypothetical protein
MWLELMPESRALLPRHVRVSGRIVYDRRRMEPECLWFDVPESCRGDLSDSGNFWLLALLPLAFQLGLPLRLSAPVDPLLFQNAQEIMQVWSRWYPRLKPVPLGADLLPEAGTATVQNTGLFFTGGVDSFFSALHFDNAARATALPGAPTVADLIHVWGFDIPLPKRAALEGRKRALSEVARLMDKHLITVVTNLRQTRLGAFEWGTFLHGPALGAVGLLLEKRFAQILLSSSHTLSESEMAPWGSHVRLDPLMSTSRTKFVHYGTSFDRFEKMALVAQSDVALRHLHVCWQEESDRNCGKCEKCWRTQVILELLGARERAASFPPGSFSLEQRQALPPDTEPFGKLVRHVYQELREQALKLSRPDVAKAIDASLAEDRPPRPSRARFRWPRMAQRWRETIRGMSLS